MSTRKAFVAFFQRIVLILLLGLTMVTVYVIGQPIAEDTPVVFSRPQPSFYVFEVVHGEPVCPENANKGSVE